MEHAIERKGNYGQKTKTPKISTDVGTYNRLADFANQNRLSISSVTRHAIAFALDKDEFTEKLAEQSPKCVTDTVIDHSAMVVALCALVCKRVYIIGMAVSGGAVIATALKLVFG